MVYKNNSENGLRKKINLWLSEHPNQNPYRFSSGRSYRLLTNQLRVLPDFIIFGSGRAGTTSLYSYLIQHPHIIAAATDNSARVADTHFFEYMTSNKTEWYKSHFPTNFYKSHLKRKHKQNIITGEFTSTYIWHPLVPKRIFNLLPTIKLIAILRNPVERAYSSYQQQLQYGFIDLTFEDIIETEFRRIELSKTHANYKIDNPDFNNFVIHNIVRHGIYADYLKNWYNIFPKEQILIVDANELNNQTEKTLENIFKFLHISNHKIQDLAKVNVGKYSPMNESTRQLLFDFYKPHNLRLYKLLGRTFDWDK